MSKVAKFIIYDILYLKTLKRFSLNLEFKEMKVKI